MAIHRFSLSTNLYLSYYAFRLCVPFFYYFSTCFRKHLLYFLVSCLNCITFKKLWQNLGCHDQHRIYLSRNKIRHQNDIIIYIERNTSLQRHSMVLYPCKLFRLHIFNRILFSLIFRDKLIIIKITILRLKIYFSLHAH